LARLSFFCFSFPLLILMLIGFNIGFKVHVNEYPLVLLELELRICANNTSPFQIHPLLNICAQRLAVVKEVNAASNIYLSVTSPLELEAGLYRAYDALQSYARSLGEKTCTFLSTQGGDHIHCSLLLHRL
jgi:hypothetical protein